MPETQTARVAEKLRQQGSIDLNIEDRKSFLNFGDDDVKRLLAIDEFAQGYAQPLTETFYKHLLSFAQGRALFANPAVLEEVKLAHTEYCRQLTQGEYEDAYVENRRSIGVLHERVGLPINSFVAMYCFYLTEVGRILTTQLADSDTSLETFLSLIKLAFMDIGLALDSYMLQRERTIEQQKESILELQRQAIRELSTPVLQLRDGLLILPIIGTIDSQRARDLTENLLLAIRANRAKAVIIDITGVATVDSAVANHLVQTVEASRLMGAKVIVSGLSAEVAQTLVTIGVDLTKLNTVGDMQSAMEEADQLIGYKVTRVSRELEQSS